MRKKESPYQVQKRLRMIIADTQESYRIMCEAHSELVERLNLSVQENANLYSALLTIFHDSREDKSRRVVAQALGIKMPPPPPSKRKRRTTRS